MTNNDIEQRAKKLSNELAGQITILENKYHHREITFDKYIEMSEFYTKANTAAILSLLTEAETRGRTSETEYWRKSGFLPLFDADKRLAKLSKLQEESHIVPGLRKEKS